MSDTAVKVPLLFVDGFLASLGPQAVFAAAAALVLLMIAGAQWVASYYTDRLALRLFALRYAIASAGWFLVYPQTFEASTQLPLAPMVTAVIVLLLHAVALEVYVSGWPAARLWPNVAAAAVAVLVIVAWRQWQPTSPVAIYSVMAGWMGWLALLAWRASRRERNAGHLLVAAAMLSYPVFVIAAIVVQGEVHSLELSYIVVIPSALAGIAVLVASLIRFGHRLEVSLGEQRAAERTLRELNATLEQRVASRTGELRGIVQGLEAFTRNVSHDLRGPLAGLAGVSRLAEQALAEGDSARARQLLRPVAEQAERLSRLVQDLLTLSRVTDAELHRVEQPLDDVVDAALQQLSHAPETADLARQVEVQREALPRATIDPGLMQQVFVNLLGNALRFAAHARGGARVRIGVEHTAGGPCIYVADNGPGIPEGQEPRLFKPFACLHGDGLSHNGIGLSIVQRVIERHRGRIWAGNGADGGAVFRFQLDVQPGHAG